MNKGWFVTEERSGDRTLDQQMLGLAPLVNFARGRHVLDVGCAEGLISCALKTEGAASVLGVDIVPGHIDVARRRTADQFGLGFMLADANEFEPSIQYDAVLLLGILHKLRNPAEACKRIAKHCSGMCVIRLPESGPVIIDTRSGSRPHDIDSAMLDIGFKLQHIARGSFNEWVGYYRHG